MKAYIVYQKSPAFEKDFLASLIAEDGTCFGDHVCSSPAYMYGDLWERRPNLAETLKKHNIELEVDRNPMSIEDFRASHFDVFQKAFHFDGQTNVVDQVVGDEIPTDLVLLSNLVGDGKKNVPLTQEVMVLLWQSLPKNPDQRVKGFYLGTVNAMALMKGIGFDDSDPLLLDFEKEYIRAGIASKTAFGLEIRERSDVPDGEAWLFSSSSDGPVKFKFDIAGR